MAGRTGRRPGKPATREAILAAASAAFAERGFDRASIRGIAAAAGVDPALVHHYFGTKDNLFLASIEAPVDPRELLPFIVEGGLDEVGERLVQAVLRVWGDPVSQPRLAAIVRSALQHEPAARLLREFFATQILRPVLAELDLPLDEAPLRGSLVASQMMGLALARYVLRLEPLASTPPDQVVAFVGPTIQRYLTGRL
jgi:AcrR family transcriptional regulator